MHKTLCGTCGLSIRAASTDGCFPTSVVKDLPRSFHSFTNSSVFNSDLHLHCTSSCGKGGNAGVMGSRNAAIVSDVLLRCVHSEHPYAIAFHIGTNPMACRARMHFPSILFNSLKCVTRAIPMLFSKVIASGAVAFRFCEHVVPVSCSKFH